MVYDNLTDADGITVGRHIVASPTPVSTVGLTKVGPDLAPVSATYAAGATGFGQKMNGGYASSPAASDLLSGRATWTLEGWFEIGSAPASVQAMFGQNLRGWIGVSASGRIVGAYNSTASLTSYVGDSTNNTAGTNPIVTGGTRRHVALVVTSGVGASLYLDGVLVASNANAPFTQAANDKFSARNLSSTTTTGMFSGTIDEVAIWSTAKYTAAFTPPTAPYVGSEAGLIGLDHLDGDSNAASY